MPNRILREGILTSQRMASLGWPEEVFYRRLHSVVDDFGRYFADFGLLRAACYPRQLNRVSDSDIGKWLQGIADAGLVRVYPAQDGERYLEVLDFKQQVRANKSKFPQPTSICAADDTQVMSGVPAHAPVFVSVSGVVSVGGKRGSRLPADWAPSLEDLAYAEKQGLVNGRAQSELEKFRDWWAAAPGQKGVKADWQATWRTWVRKAGEAKPTPMQMAGTTVSSGQASKTAAYLAELAEEGKRSRSPEAEAARRAAVDRIHGRPS